MIRKEAMIAGGRREYIAISLNHSVNLGEEEEAKGEWGAGDKGTRGQGDKETEISYPLVPLSPCPTFPAPSSLLFVLLASPLALGIETPIVIIWAKAASVIAPSP